jgi:hypothetical protein
LRWVLLGAVLAALAYLPYVLHEVRSGFANTRALAALRPPREPSLAAGLGLLLQFFGFATTDVSVLVATGFWGGFDAFVFWRGPGPERMARFYRECGAPALLLAFLPAVAALAIVLRRRPAVAAGALALLVAAGLLVTRGYYRRDSLYSIPRQKAVIAFVRAESGDDRPFEVRYAGYSSGYSTLLLARRHLGARWLASEPAADVFTVMPRAEAAAVEVPGTVVSVHELGALAVVHSCREPRP